MVLLHEALLNPLALLGENLEDLLHAHVLVDDLRFKTLQSPVQGEDLADHYTDAAAATPPRPAPPSPAQEPTLGLLGAALHECNVDRSIFCTGSGASRGAGHSPEGGDTRRTESSGQQLQRCVAHHRTCLAALADTWLTPGDNSQVLPKKGQNLTGY